jgi:hypothetical protein
LKTAGGQPVARGFKSHPRRYSEAEARRWRIHALSDLQDGKRRAPTQTTLREAGDALTAGMKAGTIRKKGGATY